MTAMTKRDAVTAAMSVAEDVAAGTLDPADLEATLVAELRTLFAVVVGPGDPLFKLQCEIARGVLAAGGIPPTELAEWAAVMRRRSGEAAAPPDTPTPPVSLASGSRRAGNDGPDADD